MTGINIVKPKSRRGMIIASVVLALILVTAGVMFLRGMLPFGNRAAHPPCDQLPNTAQAQEALEANPQLVSKLMDQGPDVSVRVGSPGCDNEDQALIEVTYSNNDESEGIENVLTHSDGFGIPVYVHKQ